ncbi:MAG: MMPL family transporter, partial [Acetobacteraceae bacterium]
EPGGAATDRLRQIIAGLEFVRAGTAHVRLTGQVPLADEEFSTVAQGAVEGLIISVVLIAVWLFLAVRTWRLIVPILLTLGLGLIMTLMFASVAVGTLNLVSVGFGVLFVGIAVDFAIQFSVRYREQRHLALDPETAMSRTAGGAGHQILFAALATAAGFLAFVPTDFAGVAELGLIAGCGMLIAFACSVTFLPAAITLFRPPGEAEEVGFAWAARFDTLTERYRWPILAVFAVLALLGAALSPRLTFDADPLHTKNPNTEAMRTLRDLIESPLTNPYTIDIMAKSQAEVDSLATKLKALPTVGGVISLFSFVPKNQAEKLAVIADANTILAPTLAAPGAATPVTPQEIRLAASTALAQIEAALPKLPPDHPLVSIAADLKKLADAPDPVLTETNTALTRFLPIQLDRLRTALSAQPVTVANVPPELARDWVAPNGEFRMQVNATPETLKRGAIREFVDQVRSVAPQAAGSAVTIEATSGTIVGAFRSAAIYAVIAITLILGVALRRVVDVLLVLAPLLLSALLTLLVVVLLPMPLNFANIIALPLLLGVGVSFNIYFVMNWRVRLTHPLASATTKAVVFSALTTATAFGSLALSAHPGTASMGHLLLISLGCTLSATLAFVPALLAVIGPPRGL